MKKISIRILLVGSLFLVAGCNKESTTPETPITPAVIQYTVNFYVGDQIVSSQVVDANETITKPVIEGTNYSWKVGDLEDRYWNFDGYFADRVNGDVNLYATTLYKATLNANGGACEAKSIEIEAGEIYSLPLPQKEASTFLGWFDNDGRLFENSGVWNFDTDITLNAKYVKTSRTFSLNVGSGTCSKTNITLEYGSAFELPIPTISTTDGGWELVFDYWKLNDKNVNNQGESWNYIDEPTEFVACYKLNNSDEYLETKYSFEYNSEKDTYKIVGRKGDMAHAFIPNTYQGKPVTEIGDNAFKNDTVLAKLTFSDNLIIIGKYAFSDCNKLNTVSLPKNVEVIGEGVFSGCSELLGVTLSNKIEIIPNKAFHNCRYLNSVDPLTSVETIGNSAFENCSLNDITFGDHLKTIGNCAFKGCAQLGGMDQYVLSISDSVESIGTEAFSNCTLLYHVRLSSSLKRIESKTFANAGLKEITIPEGVASIGSEAFSGCSYLKSVLIPSTCKIIETKAFFGTIALETIQFAEGIKVIKSQAFYPAIDLKSVTLPSSVDVIEQSNFGSVTAYYEHDNCKYLGNAENEYLYLVKVNDISITEFTTNPKTKIVSGSAFQNCNNLKKVTLTQSVTYVGHIAFGSMETLEEVRVLGPTKFGEKVFRHCPNLTTVEFANGIEEISDDMFFDCPSLQHINIPDSVKIIGKTAFFGCKKLEYLTLPASVEEVREQAFYTCEGLTRIEILGATKFGESVFTGCKNITEVTFSSGIEEIPSNMFISCTFLEKVVLPDTLKKIGTSAFFNCANLKSIDLPSSLEEISDVAFANSGLQSILIPRNVIIVKGTPFISCNIATFYCEAPEQPTGWDSMWCLNENSSAIEWGYTGAI